MKAEESYSTRRSDFTSFTEEQIVRGIFRTIADEKVVKDAEGSEFIERTVRVTEIRLLNNLSYGKYLHLNDTMLKFFNLLSKKSILIQLSII